MKPTLVKLMQVSDNGHLLTRKHRKDAPYELVEATFSKTGKTCYIDGKTYEKAKGSAIVGNGTHLCVEDGNSYIIMKHKEQNKSHE